MGEFCLFLKRIYTGELLGSPRLPVENCSAALRLYSAASMLLIDDKVPELPSVVLTSIVTPEDASMALCAVDGLPASIAELLEGLSGFDQDAFIRLGQLKAAIRRMNW